MTDEACPGADDPIWDATDAAHPAWWRGSDHAMAVFCKEANEILDGKKPSGMSSEPWQALRMRLWALTEAAQPSGLHVGCLFDAAALIRNLERVPGANTGRPPIVREGIQTRGPEGRDIGAPQPSADDVDPTKDAERLAEIKTERAQAMRETIHGQGLSMVAMGKELRDKDAALTAARREERESCAKQLEARAIAIRDHGPTGKEGLLTAIAGAHVGCLFDAAALLRSVEH